jgi:hypothetical protein
MRTTFSLALLGALGPWLVGCNDGYGVLLAKQVQNRGELVGGPVAMADVGDFLLQNDQIKVNILAAHDSQGPGVFGGSIVDVDLRRDRLGFDDQQGHDRFAELFPVANLLDPSPDPAMMQVSVLEDGSDGAEAAIRVEGEGAPLFEALGILHQKALLLRVLFPDVKTSLRFRTDYIVRPGERHVLIRTTLALEDPPTNDNCPIDPATCDTAKCGFFGLQGDGNGCLTCDCATPVPLDPYHGPVSVFGQLFGDDVTITNPPPAVRGGMVAGDFVFFGNETDVFAPGAGYDTDKVVHDAFYSGRNTFQMPLSFDFVSASAGDVSYGYFTVPPPGDTQPVAVNMPLFTSAATAFLSAGKSCLIDASDAACNAARAFTYERYLAVGEGDIASVSDDAWKTRGTATGTVHGAVFSQSTGAPSPHAQVYFFRTAPDQAARSWASVDDLVLANLGALGDYGLIDVANADRGVPLTVDGSFTATLPPGAYVVVARSQDGMALSVPQTIQVGAGANVGVDPVVITPGTVQYRVVDDSGDATPAKVALISIDAQGNPLEGDGHRRVYMGDARLGNGVRVIDSSTTGEGSIDVEPGLYRFRASRGPEYGIFEQDFEIGAGGLQIVSAAISPEVDTTGWMSTDMHLHATLSFDSGMPLPQRLASVVDEGVEFAVATDHDFETDYGPTREALFLDPYVATAIGAETTTIEQGHFISFPLAYDATIVPTHGAHDPTCESGGQILDALRESGSDPSDSPFTIVAHPRDGFFGYVYQLGVDPYTMERQVSTLEELNPVFETASCTFDAMEVINGKRFDIVRTPTIGEVVDFNRCLARLEAATTPAALDNVCPELAPGMLAPCIAGELYATCQARNRTALAWLGAKRILTRTPEEQAVLWSFGSAGQTMVGAQPLCDVKQYGQAAVPAGVAIQPCTYYSGQVDDYFRYLEHGMVRTQVASSDSHEGIHEPGFPRTFFQSPTDSPSALTTKDAITSLRAGHAVASYGPFLRASVGGKTFGDVAPAKGGGTVALDLTVETASWFGVDRIEIYENGLLVRVITPDSKPADIVDYSGTLTLDVPEKRDSWIVIIAMGLADQNLMRPVSLDVPYGEIQLAQVASDAFALIPIVNTIITAPPRLPDWFPIPAYAVSNPIFLDTDGNGKYDAPLPFPDWCSQPCNPNASGSTCPSGQGCIADATDPSEGLCGYAVVAECTYRYPWEGGGP